MAVHRLADRRRRALWSHRRRLFGNGDPERCGAVGRSVRDHDRRVHEHADLHRDRDNRSSAAAAAQAALRHEAADWDVSDLWHWRRNLRFARLAWCVDCLLAICGRGGGAGLPLARRTTEREWDVKLGIIGVGAVGAATAMAVALRARVRELVLIDKDRARARAVATDMHYGVPLSPLVTIKGGDYDDLEGAGLVIIAAGVNEKAGGATDRSDPAGRLRLRDANVTVFESIAPQLVKVAPDAVILIVTDPPEPLIDVTCHLVGHDRVIGTSTYLDSLRFRVHLAERFAVSPACVEANVVGEHGTSSVFLWSSARIGGMGVADALAKRGSGFDAFRREAEQDGRLPKSTTIEGPA